ncbi:MAG: DUF1295 domain-containing protein [Prevotellaceae bacterium]|nr:DUF1295 domain-containing protein [Prevotellaceae bacterium]
MGADTYSMTMWTMAVIAVFVFIALYFVKAGYGIFRTKQWGLSINNKAAWVMMEAPVFIVMLYMWASNGASTALPAFLAFLLFELHYFQRSFVFPLMMKGKSSMPIAIITMGIVFNVINGFLIGTSLFVFPPTDFSEGAAYLTHPTAITGIAIFFIGMGINIHSDHVIRHLRKPGDTRHYLPAKGFYRYVTSANYFGELVEWTGFALLCSTPAAWLFVVWTAANLVPRAAAIHKHYREEFGDAVGSRKRVIPFIY